MQLQFVNILIINEKINLVNKMHLERLKLIRIEKNLTQANIAEILNVKRGTYASWECGNDTIPTKQLYKLAEYYHKSCDYILGLTANNKNVFTNKEIDLQMIGENIKKVRLSNHLSQTQFATSININQSTLWAYEKGKTLITTTTLIELNKVYNVAIDVILGRKK